VAVVSLIWTLFDKAEGVIVSEKRSETTDWLQNWHIDKPVSRFAGSFEHSFDAVFGPRHLIWHCFWRSAVASYVWSLALYFLSGAFGRTHVHIQDLRILVVFTAWLNVIPDYLSLLKTR
jgi:hypothetical protein